MKDVFPSMLLSNLIECKKQCNIQNQDLIITFLHLANNTKIKLIAAIRKLN